MHLSQSMNCHLSISEATYQADGTGHRTIMGIEWSNPTAPALPYEADEIASSAIQDFYPASTQLRCSFPHLSPYRVGW